MAYRITLTEDAEQQFLALPVRDQRTMQVAIASRLTHQPTTLTRAIKQLRPNPVAAYELRAGDLRVLYNVEGDEVVVVVVGRKVGNTLTVAGEEYRGHQDDPSRSTGSRSEGNAE
jgi:mRNA-degrading endonuclease RelE of RelBE toxin-antitoxin system